MMNLFSSFNPLTSSYLSLNWLLLIAPLLFLHPNYWSLKSKIMIIYEMIMPAILYQYKMSLSKSSYPNSMMVIIIMMSIMMYNLIGLMPYSFSVTSHIVINLPLAISFWWASIKKKTLNINKTLANLTPLSTPPLLIPLMVLIEMTSMIIQPITLSVRLTANITAGHIMMILISHLYQFSLLTGIIPNMTMMILEIGVAIIQAYVFSMLVTMYNK